MSKLQKIINLFLTHPHSLDGGDDRPIVNIDYNRQKVVCQDQDDPEYSVNFPFLNFSNAEVTPQGLRVRDDLETWYVVCFYEEKSIDIATELETQLTNHQ